MEDQAGKKETPAAPPPPPSAESRLKVRLQCGSTYSFVRFPEIPQTYDGLRERIVTLLRAVRDEDVHITFEGWRGGVVWGSISSTSEMEKFVEACADDGTPTLSILGRVTTPEGGTSTWSPPFCCRRNPQSPVLSSSGGGDQEDEIPPPMDLSCSASQWVFAAVSPPGGPPAGGAQSEGDPTQPADDECSDSTTESAYEHSDADDRADFEELTCSSSIPPGSSNTLRNRSGPPPEISKNGVSSRRAKSHRTSKASQEDSATDHPELIAVLTCLTHLVSRKSIFFAVVLIAVFLGNRERIFWRGNDGGGDFTIGGGDVTAEDQREGQLHRLRHKFESFRDRYDDLHKKHIDLAFEHDLLQKAHDALNETLEELQASLRRQYAEVRTAGEAVAEADRKRLEAEADLQRCEDKSDKRVDAWQRHMAVIRDSEAHASREENIHAQGEIHRCKNRHVRKFFWQILRPTELQNEYRPGHHINSIPISLSGLYPIFFKYYPSGVRLNKGQASLSISFPSAVREVEFFLRIGPLSTFQRFVNEHSDFYYHFYPIFSTWLHLKSSIDISFNVLRINGAEADVFSETVVANPLEVVLFTSE